MGQRDLNENSIKLAERIRGELDDLDLVVCKVQRAWKQSLIQVEQQDLLLDSVALNLHSIYSGLESLFELIARNIDQSLPSGNTWHRLLLDQMSKEIPPCRPAVISSSTKISLDEYRRFRHVVRNIYTMNILPDRLEKLIVQLPDTWETIRQELNAFADFLESL